MKCLELEAIDYNTQKPIKISIDNGIIKDIRFSQIENKDGLPFVGPGLIDLQVNGISGFDFNTPDITVEDVLEITDLQYKYGVTTFFPCLITNSIEAISNEIKNIVNACERYPWVDNSIGGIHLEGPFISKDSEAKGAHPFEFIKPPDFDLVKQWQEIAKGKIKIITLSPEWSEAEEFIRKCIDSGILVSIGHTAAIPEQIRRAVKAGAKLSTHFGNGCPVKFSKRNNFFWEQLTEDNLWATIIADGFHLSEQLTKVILKLKQDKLILISDSTKFLNFKPGKYTSIIGGEVILDNEGRLFLEDNPELLAGSAKPIIDGISNLNNHHKLKLFDSWNMASTKPAELLGYDNLGLKSGNKADLVLFSNVNGNIKILNTIKSGKITYTAN